MIPFDFEDTEGKPGGSLLLDRLINRLLDTFGSLARAVTNDRLVFVTLGTSPIQVFHGMKGPPVAWEIVGRDAAETVFEPAIVNSQRGRFLFLQASGPVSVTVRFS